ncbi:hypothetical protein ACIO3O_39245 [Streptomyces sp. NPDC087440]|uniref:hypothetical protein n=1 Tax=Streptomyces sp. NPDC087440 TaxID=3365790 RepID=UPI003830DEB5
MVVQFPGFAANDAVLAGVSVRRFHGPGEYVVQVGECCVRLVELPPCSEHM